nr:MAG: glycosyltransferase family 2 protein [Anaerolineales bacterium]
MSEQTAYAKEPIDLSIIIVNWNTRDLLAKCLDSIFQTVWTSAYEIIVVDNNSTDGSVNMVHTQYPTVRFIENQQNVGFTQANNQALAVSYGRYVLLLNSDTEVQPGALDALVCFMDAHSTAGAAGGHLLNPDGSFQASHTDFPTLWREFLILSSLGRALLRPSYPSYGPEVEKGPQRVDYIEGACLLVRREAVEQVGGLDEGFFMYAEEVDWCYRMKQAGWEVWYLPEVRVIHHGGGSSRQRENRMEAELYRSRIRFFRKHYGGGQAIYLKALVYAFTFVKSVWHRPLRWLTGSRCGRTVVGLRELNTMLRGV